MMGFEIVMLLFEAQMVVIVLEIIASDTNSVIMAMGTTCSVSLTLCTLTGQNAGWNCLFAIHGYQRARSRMARIRGIARVRLDDNDFGHIS